MTLEFSHITIDVPLVSLTDAKAHLHLTDTDHDADVTDKLEAAQAYVISKLMAAADETWTETTLPRPIRAAILLMLDALYERRGGDEGSELLRKAQRAVEELIALYRDPTVA